jgi:hypothetical protein
LGHLRTLLDTRQENRNIEINWLREINIRNFDYNSLLSKELIEEYNYFESKKLIQQARSLIFLITITIQRAILKPFNLKYNNEFKLSANNNEIEKVLDTRIVSLQHKHYKDDITECYSFIEKWISAWNELSPIERFILYNDFTGLHNGKLADEDIITELGIYKDKLNHLKHSAYIKFYLLLGLDNTNLLNNDSLETN